MARTGLGAVGEAADVGLRTVGSVLMGRMLGPGGVGAWLLARTVAFDLGGVFARWGLDEAALRFVARDHGRGEARRARGVLRFSVWATLLTAFGVVLGMRVVASPLACRVFGKPQVQPLLVLAAGSLPLWAPSLVVVAALQAVGFLGLRVLTQKVIFPGVQVVVLAWALVRGWGLEGVVLAHYLGVVLMAASAVGWGRALWRKEVGTGDAHYRSGEVAWFAVPVALAELCTFVVLWVDVLMLGALSTAEQTGIYGVAQRVAGLIGLPLNAINMVFSPMIASLHATGDMTGLQRMFRATTRWALAASLPLFVLTLMTGRALLGLFGQGFQAGLAALAMLACGRLVSSATGSVGFMLNMTGHQHLNLINSLALGAVNVTLNLLWIRRWGALGAAAASALSLALVNVARVLEVRWVLGLGPFSPGYFRVLACGLLAAAMAWGAWVAVPSRGAMAVAVLLFCGAYGVGVVRWGLEPEDSQALASLVRRRSGA